MSIIDQMTPTKYLAFWFSAMLVTWAIGALLAFGLFKLTREVRELRQEIQERSR